VCVCVCVHVCVCVCVQVLWMNVWKMNSLACIMCTQDKLLKTVVHRCMHTHRDIDT
jgi:hypothetical protein